MQKEYDGMKKEIKKFNNFIIDFSLFIKQFYRIV